MAVAFLVILLSAPDLEPTAYKSAKNVPVSMRRTTERRSVWPLIGLFRRKPIRAFGTNPTSGGAGARELTAPVRNIPPHAVEYSSPGGKTVSPGGAQTLETKFTA